MQFEVVSEYRLQVSSLRLDYHYILWYKNIATFVCTMVVPFVLLPYWNTQTYRVMSKRTSVIMGRSSVGTKAKKDTFCLRVLWKARLQNEERNDVTCEDRREETSLITSIKEGSKHKDSSNCSQTANKGGKKESMSNEGTYGGHIHLPCLQHTQVCTQL